MNLTPTAEQQKGPLPIGTMRALVADLFPPRPWIYWSDFLSTMIMGYICFELVYRLTLWMPDRTFVRATLRAICFVASCLLFYRAAIFVHELAHLRKGTFRWFRVIWNVLCGIPFLMPSFTYYPHLAHHRRTDYGTGADGEYLAFHGGSHWPLLFYLLGSLVIPPLAVLRFMILVPVCWLAPPLRRWLLARASTLVMNPWYVRPPDSERAAIIALQEFLCSCWCWGVAVIITYVEPTWFWPFLVQAYATAVVVITLNSLRTLGSHRFANHDGESISMMAQIADSVNYEGNWLIREMWAPLGLSLHALHHLFPGLPYHALPEAHRRLVRELPPDGLYQATRARSLLTEVVRLLRRTPGVMAPERAAPSNPGS